MPKVSLRGINLHYYRRAGDPVLVMVHGLATSLGFWYLRVFPTLRSDLGVLLFDLRGHGRSDMPPSGYTTADMAEDVDALLQYLGIERAHLVGHSFGGAVALHYTVLYPDRVLSLTLADARIRCLQPSQRVEDWPQAAEWEKQLSNLGVPTTDDSEMGYRFLEALAESKHHRLTHDAKLARAFSPFGLARGRDRTAQRWLQLLRTTSARRDFKELAGLTLERIRTVRQPTLAIFGEYSHCLPSCRGLQENLPDCRVVTVPGVGHFHPVVRPLLFGQTLQEFTMGVHSSLGRNHTPRASTPPWRVGAARLPGSPTEIRGPGAEDG